jgi:hypothetical protein
MLHLKIVDEKSEICRSKTSRLILGYCSGNSENIEEADGGYFKVVLLFPAFVVNRDDGLLAEIRTGYLQHTNQC